MTNGHDTDKEADQSPAQAPPPSARGLVVMTAIFAALIGLVLAAGPIRKFFMG